MFDSPAIAHPLTETGIQCARADVFADAIRQAHAERPSLTADSHQRAPAAVRSRHVLENEALPAPRLGERSAVDTHDSAKPRAGAVEGSAPQVGFRGLHLRDAPEERVEHKAPS